MTDIYYSIEGKYKNGDDYYDKSYTIFELSEKLDELLDNKNGQGWTEIKNNESPIPETIIIRAINSDGDEL